MLEKAADTKERKTRIYNDHPYKYFICTLFAKTLTELYPDSYRCKDFRRWVEIQHIEKGGHYGDRSI
jgi:hypothetical protein